MKRIELALRAPAECDIWAGSLGSPPSRTFYLAKIEFIGKKVPKKFQNQNRAEKKWIEQVIRPPVPDEMLEEFYDLQDLLGIHWFKRAGTTKRKRGTNF